MDRRTFLALSTAALAATPALAAPKAELWPRWTKHGAGAAKTVDHGPWDTLLKAHVKTGASGVALVDYKAIGGRRAVLDGYLDQLQKTEVGTLDRPEQFAYWVNLYNALTVAVILDHWPVATIRDIDISPGLLSNGPWGAKLVSVEGEQLSLDDIEHRILRPIWKDPRIHYAVNCASIGCPNLAAEAYTGRRLDQMLTAGAMAYVTHPRGVSVRGGDVTASRIYDWFEEDFGGTEAGVLAHLRQYGATGLDGATGIGDYDYDWSINATGTAAG